MLRTNLAPVGGYEPIVGNRTSLRAMCSEVIRTVILERACPELLANRSGFCPTYGVYLNSNSEEKLRPPMEHACPGGGLSPLLGRDDVRSCEFHGGRHATRPLAPTACLHAVRSPCTTLSCSTSHLGSART